MPVTLAAWSWRTPLGAGPDALARVLAGHTALTTPPASLAPYGVARVATIAREPAASPHARYLHRIALLGMEAAVEALGSWSGDRDRLGVFTALGGLRAVWGDLDVAMAGQRPDGAAPWANGLGKVHPHWMLRHLSNNAHALLAITLGARGEGTTTSGPVGGATALAAAIRALEAGTLDAALVMACDTLLQPEVLLEGAVAGRWADGGPGEAAVAVVLERGEGPAIRVETGVGGGEMGMDRVTAAFGDVGAATALAQLVVLAGGGRGSGHGSGVAESGGPPGLWARIHLGEAA
ncbi:MAG: hypothetical protein Q8P18_01830 [Pseudomonadota bacterium]|nr:hypothetical protein [Pseudomonadota bacterium]